MATHKSAEKRMRQNEKRRVRNRVVRTRVRTQTKKLRSVIETGEAAAIDGELRTTMMVLQKAKSKGVLKKKTASRRIGRLAKAAHAATKRS